MRITIRLSDDLLAAVKRSAAKTGRTMTAVIEEAVHESLRREMKPHTRRRVKLPVHGAGGLHPGVDLANAARLLDVMTARRSTPLQR